MFADLSPSLFPSLSLSFSIYLSMYLEIPVSINIDCDYVESSVARRKVDRIEPDDRAMEVAFTFDERLAKRMKERK